MIRILCILSSLDSGGAETFLMKIRRVLPEDRYTMDFIVSEGGGCYTNEVLEHGGKIYAIPKRTENLFGAFCGIWKVVRHNRYRYVIKLAESGLAGLDMLVAKIAGAEFLAVRACNAPTGLSKKEQFMHICTKPLLNAVTNVKIAPSMLAAEFLFGKRHAHRDVHILHNGVDLDVFHFDPEGRERVRSEFCVENKLVVGHIGRLHRQKNHKKLLEVFSAIRQRQSNAVLLLVGVGELENAIRAQAQESGLENAVIFAGQRFDIPQMLSAMDVFVFPSLYEGMPNTVIEAQSTGLGCVISDTITREADITGLVQYLSLSASSQEWAEKAIQISQKQRQDTTQLLRENGYDIQTVAEELLRLMQA